MRELTAAAAAAALMLGVSVAPLLLRLQSTLQIRHRPATGERCWLAPT